MLLSNVMSYYTMTNKFDRRRQTKWNYGIRRKPPLADNPIRTQLIEKLMKAEKVFWADRDVEIWGFNEWRRLDDMWLREAWRRWGQETYESL